MDRTVLAALASPRRREILRLLWHGEQSVGSIHGAMPDVTMGAVSLQLKSLLVAGLVESRAEQKNRFYRVRHDRLLPLASLLEEMWNDALWSLKLAAELVETRRGPQPRRRTAVRLPPSRSALRRPRKPDTTSRTRANS